MKLEPLNIPRLPEAEQADIIHSARYEIERLAFKETSSNHVSSLRDSYATVDPATKLMVNSAIGYAAPDLHKYNVLIEGPSGTGKELIASILAHKRLPLKAMNMAGLTDSLFQSELFGYMPGAFTGAKARGDIGFLRGVGKGTAFLDEIGELPLGHQAKLLRVLQEKSVLPIGALDPIPIECRFVFATNKDLLKMVKEGTFREDLYFRINQLSLKTKSLHERGQDEIHHIAKALIAKEGWTPLSPDEYFPESFEFGNVRALFNLLLKRELGEIELPTFIPK
jgi:transcriptional regulator with PAS, ATPase and Fis domain